MQINLWKYLSKQTKIELIELASAMSLDTVYIWHRPYFDLRNSIILRRYNQLRKNTDKSIEEICAQIADEASLLLGKISVKTVQHVVYSRNPEIVEYSGLTTHHP